MILGIRSKSKMLYRKVLRALRRREQKFLRQYLRAPGTKKLHIGCYNHLLEGWLNCDLTEELVIAYGGPIYPLDARLPFPFANDTFDAVFSEHMIEHISYDEASRMLADCYRVLKPGHFIRIATPNLKCFIDLYAAKKTDLQKSYIKWYNDGCLGGREPADTFVINSIFYYWGHKFIYDEEALRRSMTDAGFVDVTLRPVSESPHSDLKNLENEGRMPPNFLKLETLVLEAMKPI